MKKSLSVILVLLLVISVFCGCAKDSSDTDKTTSATSATTVNTTETVASTTEVTFTPDGKLAAEAAVRIYMDNIDVWKYESENPKWYGYLFLDLDSDGVLELVKTEVSGYAINSDNNYYRIDTDTNSVVEISFPDKIADNQWDFNGTDYPDLYKNNATGKCHFMTYNNNRHEEVDSTITIGELYMDDNHTLKERNLWSIYVDVNEETLNLNSYIYTVFDENGNGTTVSEETYFKTLDDYEKENTNLNLEFKTVIGQGDGAIDSKAFADQDADSQYKLLLESYKAYKFN